MPRRKVQITARHFTAANALALGGSHPLDATCTPERPWGQCTGWISDGTPVDRYAFVRAVLAKYARVPGAVADAIARWNAETAEVGGAVRRIGGDDATR